jgi:DNA polymerase-3 subunit gamma/tau
MALIKLCYINQAVELSEGNSETIQKKKLVESAKPVSFKGISIIKLKELPAREITEKKKIVIEAALFVKKEIAPVVPAISEMAPPVRKKTGFGSLEKIRARLLQETVQEKTLLELNMENLQKAWTDYTEGLFTEKKYPVVTQFKMAALRIDDEFNFTVVTEGILQQRFIEMERSSLIPYMQKYFGNKLLKYAIEINEPEISPEDDKKSLSSKQQYELMINKYPLIKELKDRLKMEIDY